MSSAAQIAANQVNAQFSTGPVTAAGKLASSQSALKHGLTGRVHAALPGERDAFDHHCRAWREALAPAGVVEEELTQDIAADRWRLKRARAMENALFAQIEQEQPEQDPAAAQVRAWSDPAQGLQRLALYANRIQRAIDKNTAALEKKQAERKAACAQAREEAILLTQLAQSKGEAYDSAPDFPPTPEAIAAQGGFVYSAPEISRLISRGARLEAAQALSAAQPTPRNGKRA